MAGISNANPSIFGSGLPPTTAAGLNLFANSTTTTGSSIFSNVPTTVQSGYTGLGGSDSATASTVEIEKISNYLSENFQIPYKIF